MHIFCANCCIASVRATKSVSQLISTRTPRRSPGWIYALITPSAVSFSARLAATAAPFLRNNSTAFPTSPPDSSNALRQSIKPQPVRSRSCCSSLRSIVAMSLPDQIYWVQLDLFLFLSLPEIVILSMFGK